MSVWDGQSLTHHGSISIMFYLEEAPQLRRLVVLFIEESTKNHIRCTVLDPWVEEMIFLYDLGRALGLRGRMAGTSDGS